MRRKVEITDRCFTIRLISLLSSSIALILIPFVQLLPDKATQITSYLIAAIFWIGFIFVIVFTFKINSLMNMFDTVNIDDDGLRYRRTPGIISFTFERMNIVLYAICIIGFLILVSDMIFHYLSGFLMFPMLSIVFFTFSLHSIVDGKNYKLYIKIKEGMEKRV